MPPRLRALYICYQSLRDPLVHTQVVAYLEGLAERGHTIHLLTFEPRLSRASRQRQRAELRERGIVWHSLRYHKRLSLPATIFDSLLGALVAARLVKEHGLDAVHARSHVPAGMALIVRRLTGAGLIFDIRGLLAEEYINRGRWRRGGVPHRITDRVQRMAIERSDGIVTLTERVRPHLFGAHPPEAAVVIPCCADLDGLAPGNHDGQAVPELAGLEDRPVMVYVGKLTPPYMDREMVDFFCAARRVEPRLVFLVVTQAPPETIAAELARAGIPECDYRITQTAPGGVGAYLAGADFAICFCQPTLSLTAASPTKIGEYLAAGLPVVSGPGVGDVADLIEERGVGVVIGSFGDEEYVRAAGQVLEQARDPEAVARCQEVAREHFSLTEVGIPRYDRLYAEVARKVGAGAPAPEAQGR